MLSRSLSVLSRTERRGKLTTLQGSIFACLSEWERRSDSECMQRPRQATLIAVVEGYVEAQSAACHYRVAQTSLREMIGSSVLATLLSDRKQADEQLKVEIGEKTAPWGISVSSVEIRDVAIPAALQDAMSRQAQAEREKQARVILGSAEAAIASSFVAAADTYVGHPMALQLRAMNIIYETTKERGATILMPSSMVDSLNPSAKILGLALAGNEAVKANGGLERMESPEAPLPARTAA